MKKHNFEQAMSIFKGMFEGWSVVTKDGVKKPMDGIDVDPNVNHKFGANDWFEFDEISHLEQTLPMNGDKVMAWSTTDDTKLKGDYIGKHEGVHVVHCWLNDEIRMFNSVKLAKEPLQLTIEQATELLKRGEKVDEPFEIVKE